MPTNIGLARLNRDTSALYLNGALVSTSRGAPEPADWMRLLRQIPGVRLDNAVILDPQLSSPPADWAAVEVAQRGEADRTQEAQRLRALVAEKTQELARLEARLASRLGA